MQYLSKYGDTLHHEFYMISVMVKFQKSWKWPEKKDEMWYDWECIIGGINPPKQITKRGIYRIPELEKLWWE